MQTPGLTTHHNFPGFELTTQVQALYFMVRHDTLDKVGKTCCVTESRMPADLLKPSLPAP